MNKAISCSALLLLLACSDPAEGVAPAQVTSPATTAPTTTTAARQTLNVDRASSTIGFTGAKVTMTHDGTFSDFSGTIDLDPQNVIASSVRMTVQIASLHIEPERLSQHLLTADFFDATQFPTATFESTEIRGGSSERVGDQPATHTVTGNLTLRGQTRAISFPAIINVTGSEVRAQSAFSIDRRDFGIVYPGMPDNLIRDAVAIRFDIHAPRT